MRISKLILLWLSGFLLGLPTAFPQNQNPCPEFERLTQTAMQLLENRDYKGALGKLSVARDHCFERAGRVDTLVLVVFDSIEYQKKLVTEQWNRAEMLRKELQVKNQEITSKNTELLRLINSLEIAYKNLEDAQKAVDSLVAKSITLQNNLAGKNAQKFIAEQARRYFDYDASRIYRDYQNALTYFAVSNFLNKDARTQQLINACKDGLKADSAFHQGLLDSAQHLYEKVRDILESAGQNPEYERIRLRHIEEVRKLASPYRATLPPEPETLIFEGNWWTIPHEFYQYKRVRTLVFVQDSALYDGLNIAPNGFPLLTSIHVRESPRLRSLLNWSSWGNIQALNIRDNPELENLEGLEALPQLTALFVVNNERLKTIKGMEALPVLRELSVRANPRLMTTVGLPRTLQRLDLANVAVQQYLNLTGLDSLQSLEIDSLSGLRELHGIENLSQLQILNIDHNSRLQIIGPLRGLNALECLSVVDNDSLRSLRNIERMPALKYVTIDYNLSLTQLPRWRYFPRMEKLYVRDNSEIIRFGNLLPLKNLKKAEVLGNKQLVTLAVGIAPGFVFGGQRSSNKEANTYFDSPSLTLSASIKMVQLAFQVEYTIFNRDYFPTDKYPFNNCRECRDYFQSIRQTDPGLYGKRTICNIEKNRLRLMLRYDIYPFFPIGPVYYIGGGVTVMAWDNYPPLIAAGAMIPLKYNYLSLDYRMDFSEFYWPYDLILTKSISLSYNIRLGYKKTLFRESHLRREGKRRPRRLF